MTAIICALYDEAFELLKTLYPAKANGIRYYIGVIKDTPVSLYLSRPGLPNREKIRRFLRLYDFHTCINIGFAGALKNNLEVGQLLKVSEVQDFCKNKIKINKTGVKLTSVNHPVVEVSEKNDLHLLTGSDIVDMEAYRLIELLREPEFATIEAQVLKIVGDRLSDRDYLEKEEYMRSYFKSRSIIEKLKIIFNTGVADFFILYRRKKKLQKKLKSSLFHILVGQQK